MKRLIYIALLAFLQVSAYSQAKEKDIIRYPQYC